MHETARVKVRLLARLILSELAERAQRTDEDVLDELILQEAVRKLAETAERRAGVTHAAAR